MQPNAWSSLKSLILCQPADSYLNKHNLETYSEKTVNPITGSNSFRMTGLNLSMYDSSHHSNIEDIVNSLDQNENRYSEETFDVEWLRTSSTDDE